MRVSCLGVLDLVPVPAAICTQGYPSCANKWLLTDVARDAWGFDGCQCHPTPPHIAGAYCVHQRQSAR